MLSKTIVDSPIGPLWLFANDDALVAIEIPERSTGLDAKTHDGHPVLDLARRWLSAYFAGESLPELPKLAPEGTPFQQGVWRAMLAIDPGKTLSYGAIARALNRPNGARAVGMACGRNPIPVIIPCHRVIGTSGALTGFGWGMQRKVWLLSHEGCLPKTGTLDQAEGNPADRTRARSRQARDDVASGAWAAARPSQTGPAMPIGVHRPLDRKV